MAIIDPVLLRLWGRLTALAEATPQLLRLNARQAPSLSRTFNRVLDGVAAERSNLWVADWLTAVHEHSSWLQRDGIHATTRGSRGRARLVAATAHAAFVGGIPAAPPAGCSISTMPLKVRTRGSDSLCLELRLHQLRYQHDTPDERFGSTTRDALIAWQALHGLAATGVLDTVARAALGLAPPD